MEVPALGLIDMGDVNSGRDDCRATLIVAAEDDGLEAALDWLDQVSGALSFVSENQGCGCCVHIFDLAGPAVILDGMKPAWRADSDWTAAAGRSRGRRLFARLFGGRC